MSIKREPLTQDQIAAVQLISYLDNIQSMMRMADEYGAGADVIRTANVQRKSDGVLSNDDLDYIIGVINSLKSL